MAGEANDAVSRALQTFAIAGERAPTSTDKTTTQSETETMDSIEERVVPLSETCTVTHWQDCCGNQISKPYFSNTNSEKSTNMGMSLLLPNITSILVVSVDDMKMVGKKNLDQCGKCCEKKLIGKNRPMLNQVHLGCTHGEAGADHHTVQSKSEPVPTNDHHCSDEWETEPKYKFLFTEHRVEL